MMDKSQAYTMAALDLMGSAFAHKLKNPLAGMMLACTRLQKKIRKKEPTEKLEKLVNQLCDSVASLGKAVDEVAGKLESLELQNRAFDLNETVLACIDEFAQRMSEAGLNISTDLSPEIPAIHGDPELISAGISRFLSDALRVMPEGGGLEIGTSQLDGKARLTIADTRLLEDFESFSRTVFKPFKKENLDIRDLDTAVGARILQLQSVSVEVRERDDSGVEFAFGFPVK